MVESPDGEALFEWDEEKELANWMKHKVWFFDAIRAFDDPEKVITPDITHSEQEDRYFCLGAVDGRVMTVRFTWRDGKIRIFGAAYWRKGRKDYGKKKH